MINIPQKSHRKLIEITFSFWKGLKLVISYKLYPCGRGEVRSILYTLREKILHGIFFFPLFSQNILGLKTNLVPFLEAKKYYSKTNVDFLIYFICMTAVRLWEVTSWNKPG